MAVEKPKVTGPLTWYDGDFSEMLALAFDGRIIYIRADAVGKMKKPSRREVSESFDD